MGSLVPIVFDHYARILHPGWSAARRPARWDVVAAWSGRTAHALAQWERLSVPVPGVGQTPPFVAPPDTGELEVRPVRAADEIAIGSDQVNAR